MKGSRDQGMTTMKTLASAFAAAFVLFSLTACNTVQGAGQDISSAGRAIERAAD